MSGLAITVRGTAVRFSVRVQPRASRSEVDGLHGDALKIRVHAPPVDGAANEAVIEVLAEALAVPRRAITIVTGQTARTKVVEVEGVDVAAIEALADA